MGVVMWWIKAGGGEGEEGTGGKRGEGWGKGENGLVDRCLNKSAIYLSNYLSIHFFIKYRSISKLSIYPVSIQAIQ